jgi:stress response protein YsnF
MITREQSSAVLDHPVLDSSGQRIGSAAHVFLDDATGAPSWVGVKAGLFGGGETLIPVDKARMDGENLAVPYSKQKVKDAPHVHADARGHISPDQERQLHDYYAGAMAAGMAAGTADAGTTSAGTATDTGLGTDTDTGMASADETVALPDRDLAGGEPRTTADAGMASGTARAGMDPSAGRSEDWSGRADDRGTVMTRSEEQMHVHTERREAGHAGLHRHVVVEEVERTVPLHHEHARLVREPIADGDRSAALAQQGTELADADYELTLWDESPVVEKEVVPVERVRLVAEDEVTEETVRARVRHEEIEIDGDIDQGVEGDAGRRI